MRKQAGFTLIELIMVIVILGVLSAFALPRFADLGGEARRASIQGAQGAVRSAANIAHAQWLADGGTAATVVLEGLTFDMTAAGYPDGDNDGGNNSIIEAAQLSAQDYTLDTSTATQLTVTLGTCSFTYDEDDGSVTAIVDTDATTTEC